MTEPRTAAGRALHAEWHDGESYYLAPKECGTIGCGFLGRILVIEDEAAELAGGLDAERLARVKSLHAPTWERDFIQVPAKNVKVCGSCYLGNDDFHMTWPCPTAEVLGLGDDHAA